MWQKHSCLQNIFLQQLHTSTSVWLFETFLEATTHDLQCIL